MNPPLLRAVVLRTRPYSETSLWVRLYSESSGKISGLAKGGRRGRERMYSALIEVEARAYPPRTAESGLWNLSRPELVTDWRNLTRDPDRLAYAWGVLETVDQLVEEMQAHPELYRLLTGALTAFESHPAPQAAGTLIWFLIHLADVLGYSLQWEICPRCGEPLVYPVGAFVTSAGGVLCARCSPSPSGGLAEPEWIHLVELASAAEPPGSVLPLTARDRLLALVSDFLSYHAERPLWLRSLQLLSDFGNRSPG